MEPSTRPVFCQNSKGKNNVNNQRDIQIGEKEEKREGQASRIKKAAAYLIPIIVEQFNSKTAHYNKHTL